MTKVRTSTILSSLLLCLLLASNAVAIVVSPSTDTSALANALLGSNPGIVIKSVTLDGRTQEQAMSTGTYTNSSGIFGIGPGLVVSSGDVSLSGDNLTRDMSFGYNIVASPECNDLLAPITGRTAHYDCTRLDIEFDLLPGYNGISIDAVFGTEEYPSWQNTIFNDGMGIYLNDINIAVVDEATLNISNSSIVDARYVPGTEASGLNGLLTHDSVPLLHFSHDLANGALSNRLTIIIADASDASLDTVAFLGNLSANQVPYALSNWGASHPLITTASTKFSFKVWGRVTLVSQDSFTLDDGSAAPVTVVAPGFSGIVDGDYATAVGKFSGEGSARVLTAKASAVVKAQ